VSSVDWTQIGVRQTVACHVPHPSVQEAATDIHHEEADIVKVSNVVGLQKIMAGT